MAIKQDQQVWSVSFFDKKTGLRANVNGELAQELHRPVIEKFKRRKICAGFNDDIWAADLAEVGSYLHLIVVLNIYCV